ncbi:unnamed protein product [Peronospora belbahrii]|uniref:Uncharacterized protein n=1 Tax=Peronospora belbahrii TaxID=622444 RepID=A0AAU9KTC8_9STRA|nr:unnamed protein product [Peronospora belbahrii]CAH0518373.1 unnamed protein product [Peronospora belbahrii]
MSSSCVVPVSPVASLKRGRSTDDDLHLFKAAKQDCDASPHAMAAAVVAQRQQHILHHQMLQQQRQQQQYILHHQMLQRQQQQQQQQQQAVSPFVLACGNIRYAITFIQNSRRHALALCLQNQWERALTVLEKIERANDKISRQRRAKVREQANADVNRVFDVTAMPTQQPQVLSPVKAIRPKKHVRFSDEVQVAQVELVDRSPAPMPLLMRDEILVLRASRPIPLRNFSEFWSSSL